MKKKTREIRVVCEKEYIDGLDILDQMGYDVDWLRNEVKSYT